MKKLVCGAFLLCCLPALPEDIRAYRTANEKQILNSFVEFLSIPNVASDPVNIARNADYIVKALAERGVTARLLHAPDTRLLYMPRSILPVRKER